jgi:hypothetical protein
MGFRCQRTTDTRFRGRVDVVVVELDAVADAAAMAANPDDGIAVPRSTTSLAYSEKAEDAPAGGRTVVAMTEM